MDSDSTLNNVLEALYAAPMHPPFWNLFLERLSAFSGVTKAALLNHNNAKNDHRILAILGDRLKETVPLYEEFYFQHDEWTLRFPRRGLRGTIIQGEELWPRESLYKSTFYNEFLQSMGVRRMACVALGGAADVFDSLSIYSGSEDDGLNPDVLVLLKMLVPHLQTALKMRRMLAQLESRVSDLENALDLIEFGVVLLDANGKCLLANKRAQSILNQRDGIFLDRATLCTNNSMESAKLQELTSSAISAIRNLGHQSGGAMLITRENAKALQILMAPLRREIVPGQSTAVGITFISDPEQRTAAPSEVLQVLFGLTFAEARLAVALLDGNSLSEAAEVHRVSQETVRTQVKSIFHKTGTRRQGELIRLLAGVSCPKS